MGYFIFSGILALWTAVDAHSRDASNVIEYAIGTLIFSVLVLPFYLAKRPLKEGEVREGGTAWNVLRYFAVLWTLAMLALAAQGCFNAVISTGEIDTASDAESIGWGIGVATGMGFLACAWFIPLVGALALGLFLKKSHHVERGPTGPLADDEKDPIG